MKRGLEIITKQLKEIEEIEIDKSHLDEKGIFKSKKLFQCILGLNDLESNVLSYLIKHSHTGTSELTKFFEMDRSSIQRVLQNLTEVNLIKRESMSLKAYEEMKGFTHSNKRGYLYVYSAMDVEFIKAQFKTLLDKWYGSMLNYIEHLDSLFDCFETEGELCL